MKKYSDEYMAKRQIELSKFMSYCLASEMLKTDQLFDAFIDLRDHSDYKKVYSTQSKLVEEVHSINQIIALPSDGQNLIVKLPDDNRLKKAEDTIGKMQEHMFIYNVTQERLYQSYKRLGQDMQQVCGTIQNIRECTKTLETMEKLYSDKFGFNSSPFVDIYDKLDLSMNQWNHNLVKQQKLIQNFS